MRELELSTSIDDTKTIPWLDRRCREGIFSRLGSLNNCQLAIIDPEGKFILGEITDESQALYATLTIDDPAFYRLTATKGLVGVTEAYIDGLWDASDLVQLVRIIARNREALKGLDKSGSSLFGRYFMRLLNLRNRNSLRGSKRNISAHYDLGNDFFKLFLDQRLMYSSAIFESPEEPLEVASTRKLETICRKLDLQASDHLIEIGTGWGGFAIYAAKNYGCRVTTTTISQEQYNEAVARIQQAGLQDRIQVLLKDYRELQGQYDKLVSIEMIEAVGHEYLPRYFEQCSHLLKPGGQALIQAITIEDYRYEHAVKSVDFIKRYIFPGGFLPCIRVMVDNAANAYLRLVDLEDIGLSYAHTLRKWREQFLLALDQVKAQGYNEAFIRTWLMYLCYCEGSFNEKAISTVQMLFAKPEHI